MKIRGRLTIAAVILAVSGLSGVSVGCSILCSMAGSGDQTCGCLTESCRSAVLAVVVRAATVSSARTTSRPTADGALPGGRIIGDRYSTSNCRQMVAVTLT